MQKPWLLERHMFADEIEAIEKKHEAGTATKKDIAHLRKLQAARKANTDEQDVIKQKIAKGIATAEDMARLRTLQNAWKVDEESPPRSLIPGRKEGAADAEKWLEMLGCPEKVFRFWQEEEGRFANLDANTKKAMGYMTYHTEGMLAFFREYFGKSENRSKLNPDTDKIPGLDFTDRQTIRDFIRQKQTEEERQLVHGVIPTTIPNAEENLAILIMAKNNITRPQAKKIVLAMVNMGATSEECAKTEKAIMKKAGVKSRIVSVFSDRSGDAKAYGDFRKRIIGNTGTRQGLYYLHLS